MPKIFTTTPGAVIRIGGHGTAMNERGVLVALDVAGELADRQDLRVEWDGPGQEAEARGAHRQRLVGDLDQLLKAGRISREEHSKRSALLPAIAAPRPEPKPLEAKPRRFGKETAAPDTTAENEE